jgi:hypothetical protein
MSGTSIVPFYSDSQKNSNKIIAWLTGLLTLLLALFSFILSFTALTDLAAKHRFSIPFLFPLVVEAGVVIFSLNALNRSTQGESTKWQWSLIIGSSFLAGGFNILHAQPDVISRIMAAMPSLFLLLSFETFLGQIKHGVTRANAVQSIVQLMEVLNNKRRELDVLIDSKQSEINKLNTEADKLNGLIDRSRITLAQLEQQIKQAQSVQHSSIEQAKDTKAKQDALVIEQRRSQLLNILATEGDIGASAIADRLHISRGTVYSDLKALSEAGQVVKNGNGWEVVG